MHVATYLGLLRGSEQQLADACLAVGERHRAEADIRDMCTHPGAWSQIHMEAVSLEGDTEAAAIPSSTIIADPRAAQFYDADRRVGTTIAQGLGGPGEIAWDIYLFYPPGPSWDASPPAPIAWMHQLGVSWADPAHRHCGADLVEQLRHTMQRLVGSADVP